jgi:hypothetical protein
MRYLCFLTHYFSVRSLCFPSPLSDYCGPWLQRYSTFSTFSWSLHAYRHIECCSILCILSTVCYSILCDNNTRAFSPALLTKISEKNWFLQILFFVPRNVNAVSFCNLSWLYVSIFANSFAHKVINLHFLALHIPKTKSEIFPDVKWISC